MNKEEYNGWKNKMSWIVWVLISNNENAYNRIIELLEGSNHTEHVDDCALLMGFYNEEIDLQLIDKSLAMNLFVPMLRESLHLVDWSTIVRRLNEK